jgi:hypothetical protein
MNIITKIDREHGEIVRLTNTVAKPLSRKKEIMYDPKDGRFFISYEGLRFIGLTPKELRSLARYADEVFDEG